MNLILCQYQSDLELPRSIVDFSTSLHLQGLCHPQVPHTILRPCLPDPSRLPNLRESPQCPCECKAKPFQEQAQIHLAILDSIRSKLGMPMPARCLAMPEWCSEAPSHVGFVAWAALNYFGRCLRMTRRQRRLARRMEGFSLVASPHSLQLVCLGEMEMAIPPIVPRPREQGQACWFAR